jgi:hypothetical protein
MNDYAIWVHIVLGISLAIAACCGFALFGDQIRRTVAAFGAIFTEPLAAVQSNCARWIAAVRDWLRSQLADESARKEDGPLYFIIGAVVYSILTLVFMLCDWGMIVLTAEGMGLDTSRFELPIDNACLTATTLVTAALFWGSVLFDALGVTHIAPWYKSFSPIGRRFILLVSMAFITLAVTLGSVMAYWRGDMLTAMVPEAAAGTMETGMEAGGLDLVSAAPDALSSNADPEMPETQFSADELRRQEQMVKFSLVGLAVLSGGSTAFSMVGVMKLAKFIILAAIGIASLPLLLFQGVTWLLVTVFNLILNFVHWGIDLLIAMGTRVLGVFGVQAGEAQPDARISGQETAPDVSADTPSANDPSAGSEEAGFNPFARR